MDHRRSYSFAAPFWVHPGEGGWHFLTVPPIISADIAERTTAVRVSFGSVRVDVVVGGSAWHTSLFPDAKTRTYLLPVKKNIRVAEQLRAGDMVDVELKIES